MINSSIDKSLVITAVMAELQLRYQVAQDAVQSALDAATNEQTIPEHKYDTLALEASYLAHGQAKRVQECEQDIKQFKNLVSLAGNDKVAVGSLVQLLDEQDNARWVLFSPCAGGMTVEHAGQRITLVTLKSPLGAALFNKSVDDEVVYHVGDKAFCYQIAAID